MYSLYAVVGKLALISNVNAKSELERSPVGLRARDGRQC